MNAAATRHDRTSAPSAVGSRGSRTRGSSRARAGARRESSVPRTRHGSRRGYAGSSRSTTRRSAPDLRAPGAPSYERQSGSHPTRGISQRRESLSSPWRSTSTPCLPTVVLPREEDRRSSQDLPLHPQRRVLIPQPVELLALLAAQPAWPLAPSGLVLPRPVPERDIRESRDPWQLALGLVSELRQPDRLAAELLRIWRPRSGHPNHTFPAQI